MHQICVATFLRRCVGRHWAVRRLVICSVFACFITIWMVACSISSGRLSIYPRFDDVAYLDDGLRRLSILHEHGCSALAADYRLWPPHAPVSTALAFGAFEICGPHDWAPYAANGLLVFGYLFLGSFLLPRGSTLADADPAGASRVRAHVAPRGHGVPARFRGVAPGRDRHPHPAAAGLFWKWIARLTSQAGAFFGFRRYAGRSRRSCPL